MNREPLISCLMATYGRRSFVERSLACFLTQDYENRELVILNTHAVPLVIDHMELFRLPLAFGPGTVRIYNEPCWSTLGDQRNRLLDLAQGDLIRTWDDDDFYLPWSISQGVQGILDSDSPAWKPLKSWWTPDGGKTFSLAENTLEPSITIRADVARKYRYRSTSSGDEHLSLLDGLSREGGIAIEDAGTSTGFCYIWGEGNSHISGSLDHTSSLTAIERAANWRAAQQDVKLSPIKPDWTAYSEWVKRLENAGATEPKSTIQQFN